MCAQSATAVATMRWRHVANWEMWGLLSSRALSWTLLHHCCTWLDRPDHGGACCTASLLRLVGQASPGQSMLYNSTYTTHFKQMSIFSFIGRNRGMGVKTDLDRPTACSHTEKKNIKMCWQSCFLCELFGSCMQSLRTDAWGCPLHCCDKKLLN